MDQSRAAFRLTLGILLLIMAISCFAGGYYGLSGAADVPIEWLWAALFVIILSQVCFCLWRWGVFASWWPYLY